MFGPPSILLECTAAMEPDRGTVYIVDEDPSVRRALERLAISAGLAATAFGTGTEFLASPRKARPACLVLALRLPDMHGLEVQRKLARTDPDVPVIVVTAYGDDFTLREAFLGGAVAFLNKPFDDDTLLEAIRRALSEPRSRPGP